MRHSLKVAQLAIKEKVAKNSRCANRTLVDVTPLLIKKKSDLSIIGVFAK